MNWLLTYLLLFCGPILASAVTMRCYHCDSSNQKSGVSLSEDSCAQFETSPIFVPCALGVCFTIITFNVSDPTFYEVSKGCTNIKTTGCNLQGETNKCQYGCTTDGCNSQNPVPPETTTESQTAATLPETSADTLASTTLLKTTNSSHNSSTPFGTISNNQDSVNGVGKAKTNVLDLFISCAVSFTIWKLSPNS